MKVKVSERTKAAIKGVYDRPHIAIVEYVGGNRSWCVLQGKTDCCSPEGVAALVFAWERDLDLKKQKDPNLISACGCRFRDGHSSAVILCDECSYLSCHTGDR